MKDDTAETVAIATTTSMVAVIAIIALLLLCCFGFGALIICSYQVTKASKQIKEVQTKHAQMKEMKRKGQANASES